MEIVALFEIYKGLLTEKQREIFSAYYCYDLSLAEIAEQEGSSRQSVHEIVKKVRLKLIELENQLKISEKESKLFEIAEFCDGETSKKIKEIIGK